ncbi:MAG: DUF4197 domain-containing protein [Pseudomonadales bacterium]
MATPIRARAVLGYLALTASLLVLSHGSHAASGWFDRLKGIFGGDEGPAAGALTTSEIGRGLGEALRVGTERVVAQLGQPDGFNLDPEVRIPLPRQLERARRVMARVGMDATLADLEVRLNRAAEIATPRAKSLFLAAITDLTLEDVMAVYNGPEDAATRHFRSRMSEPLAIEMRPVVEESLADAGAVQLFDDLMDRYRAVPFAPAIDADLAGYVVEQAIDGIFFYLAREEAAIRADPAKRTTELLRRVFGR